MYQSVRGPVLADEGFTDEDPYLLTTPSQPSQRAMKVGELVGEMSMGSVQDTEGAFCSYFVQRNDIDHATQSWRTSYWRHCRDLGLPLFKDV